MIKLFDSSYSIGNRDKGVYFSGISKTSPLRSDDGELGQGSLDNIYLALRWDKIYKLNAVCEFL